MINEICFRAGNAPSESAFDPSDELMFQIFGVDREKLVDKWPMRPFMNIGSSSAKKMRLATSNDDGAEDVSVTQKNEDTVSGEKTNICACGSELQRLKLELVKEQLKWYKRHNENEIARMIESGKNSGLSEPSRLDESRSFAAPKISVSTEPSCSGDSQSSFASKKSGSRILTRRNYLLNK